MLYLQEGHGSPLDTGRPRPQGHAVLSCMCRSVVQDEGVAAAIPQDPKATPGQMTTFTPRDYQVGAIEAGVNHLLYGKGNNFLVLPTGSGKSLIVAGIANGVTEPVLVLQPTKEILHQNYQKMRSYGHLPAIFSASEG